MTAAAAAPETGVCSPALAAVTAGSPSPAKTAASKATKSTFNLIHASCYSLPGDSNDPHQSPIATETRQGGKHLLLVADTRQPASGKAGGEDGAGYLAEADAGPGRAVG